MPRQMHPNNANMQNMQSGQRMQGEKRQEGVSSGASSPAFIMASRIKNEQGVSRAAEYLQAMSPYLAPGERQHIASLLSLPSAPPPPQYQPQYQPQPPQYQPQYQPQPPQFQTPMRNGGNGAAGNGGGMGDTMQLMNMLSMLNGGGLGGALGGLLGGMNAGGAGGGANNPVGNPMGNPMLLAQLLGGMMGKK